MSVLRNPSAAPITDYLAYLMHENLMNQFTTNTHGVHGFLAHSKLSAIVPPALENSLLAASKGYIFYALGRWNEAAQCVNALIPIATPQETDFLICLKRYLSLKINNYSSEDINKVLNYLHKEETVQSLQSIVNSNQNPFDSFTLHCDCIHCEGCRLKEHCCQKRVMELAGILNEQTKKLNFDNFCRQMTDILNNL